MRLFSRRSFDVARSDRFARSRWAAAGAAVAVAASGLLPASASLDTGDRPVFVPITPCRLVDTRPAPEQEGPRGTPLTANETLVVLVHGANGNCLIPTDAVGVVMNVAAISPTSDSYLTVFPSDAAKPLAANLNWVAGQPPVSNAVTADLSADGRVSFYNLAGTVNIAADVVGYFVDHTHDDRYYTKAQSDAAITAGVAGAIDPTELAAALATKADKPTGTHAITIDPSAFSPAVDAVDYSTTNGDFRTGTGTFEINAPVVLPQSAVVTRVEARVFDIAAANVAVTLLRNPATSGGYDLMADTGSTSGAPTAVTLTDNSIDFATIDNTVNSFVMRVQSITSGIIFYSATITYTLP